MKKPAVNFFPFSSPALQSSSGAEEIAANPACRMRYYRKAGVDPATAPFVLRTIRAKYGSAENYLEAEYGLTPARLMRLRRMYLE